MQKAADRKPSICMILPRKLFPLLSGYSLKNYYLIRLLSREYSLHLTIISSEVLEKEEQEFYQTYTKSYQVYQMNKAERMLGAAAAFFGGLPIQVGLYHSRTLKRQLEEEVSQADIFIGELVRTMPYAELCPQHAVKVFDMVDSIGLNYQRSMGGTSSLFLKLYYKIEMKRLLSYEKRCIQSSDVSFLFNQKEQEYWSEYGNIQWLPHGVKEELLDGIEKKENDTEKASYIAFIGKMNYQPNIDAVLWYAEHIHSKLSKKIGFVIVGAYPTAEVRKLQEKYENITVTGFVEDPYEILLDAVAVAAPMQTGGGIQNKVLEAMAIGKVNLLSSLAAQPIVGAEDGVHFCVCDTLEEYEKTIHDLLSNPEKREQIENNAREFIQNNFTWEKYGETYISCLNRLLAEKR